MQALKLFLILPSPSLYLQASQMQNFTKNTCNLLVLNLKSKQHLGKAMSVKSTLDSEQT